MLHLYPETPPDEQTLFDSSYSQSFEQDREEQPHWICLVVHIFGCLVLFI
jgi:hypothetical protein